MLSSDKLTNTCMNIKGECRTRVYAKNIGASFFRQLLFFIVLFLGRAYGQEVRINAKEMSLESVFQLVEKQTGLITMYSNDELNAQKKKQFTKSAYNLRELYALLLKGENLQFEIGKKYVVIKAMPERSAKPLEPEPSQSGRETVAVSGKVVDGTGQPLPGVTVTLKDTRISTVTDYGGKFLLKVPKERNNLRPFIFSYLGKPKVERYFFDEKDWTITISEGETAIDEVVVTGYQRINRRQLTSAVTTIKAEDILRPDLTSIDQMLEGQVPDMMFMSNSGEVGVVPKLRIRGTSSLIGNREPLWVVDGVVVQDPVRISPEELNDPDYINRIGNAIAGLNPQDIERLDILKDAAATGLYGVKAANGVIVVTTKRGRIGKPTIQYSTAMNYKLRPRYTDRAVNLMNSKERIMFSKELLSRRYHYPNDISWVGYESLYKQLYEKQIDQSEFDRQVQRLETLNTDWFALLTEDNFSQQHNLSVSGGSQQGRYYASIGYTAGNDVIKSNKNRRYTAVLNLDTELNKWLSASFGLNANVSDRDYYQEEIAPLDYAYKTSRAIPAYEDDGSYAFYRKRTSYSSTYNYNILNELEHSGNTQKLSGIRFNTNLRFKFLDWLSGNAQASYSVDATGMENYWDEKTNHVAELRRSEFGVKPTANASLLPAGGELGQNTVRNNNYTARLQLDANKYFGTDNKHNISGSIGSEMSSTHYQGHQSVARGYFKDRGKTFAQNLDLSLYQAYRGWLASNVPKIQDDLANTLSYYGVATYGFKRLFYVNANARVDGSNRFGSSNNKKFLPVWSVSGSLNVAEIGKLKTLDWMDFLNFKASYGFQGNVLAESPVLIIKKNPLDLYYNENTASIQKYPNPNLKWERTATSNFGFDASLFKSKLLLEGSLYFKRTKDAYLTKTISTINGRDSYVINSGEVNNHGYSISMTVSPIMKEKWRWTVTGSFSKVFNSLKTKPDAAQYEYDNFLNGTALVKDKPVGTFYSYRFLGLSADNGGPLFDDYQDRRDQLMGLSKYDTFTKVLEASGNREPFMSGGFNTSLRYRQFRIGAMFAYSLGAKTRLFGVYTDAESSENTAEIRPEVNFSRDLLNRWQQAGDELRTSIPAIISTSDPAYSDYSSHFSFLSSSTSAGLNTYARNYWDMYDYSNLRVVSASFLKLSSLSFGYELPEAWLKKYGLSRLGLSLSGSNLYTWSARQLRGQTPTQGGFSKVQLSERPSFSFGINISF